MEDVPRTDRFTSLREQYYLSGRTLIISQLYDIALINFGYSLELALKQILLGCEEPEKTVRRYHHLERYYCRVCEIAPEFSVSVSEEFIQYCDRGLNSRYPSHQVKQLESNPNKIWMISMSTLHCYDDLLLQLDDYIARQFSEKCSIGLRAAGNLEHVSGRVFFHCNDAAHNRIMSYRARLENPIKFEALMRDIGQKGLWNFELLPFYRPWGPKSGDNPAKAFSQPEIIDGSFDFKAPEWKANGNFGGFFTSCYFTAPSDAKVVWSSGHHDP